VGLDDPIQKYVPSLPDKGAPITLRHVLTHTSGIRHYRSTDFPGTGDNENMRPVASLEEGIRIFKDDPLLFAPGAYYSYSSYAVNLLQGVVETASGLPFEESLRRHVWGPAGMLSTQFDVPERVVPNRAKSYRIVDGRPLNSFYGDLTYKFAGGGMISTAEDLVRLGAALNRGGLLRPETVALMVRPHLDPVMRYVEGGAAEREEWKLGLMWRLSTDDAGRPFVFHSGSVKDFNAMLVNYPERDLVVALLSNAGQGRPRADALALAGFFLAAAQPATSP
jgi:CubicO group peptidase (beta-lactamase class C family)